VWRAGLEVLSGADECMACLKEGGFFAEVNVRYLFFFHAALCSFYLISINNFAAVFLLVRLTFAALPALPFSYSPLSLLFVSALVVPQHLA
jgi:pilus assembly protein TadC